MTHAGWLYKVLIDKHVTGPPLDGQVQIFGIWGTPGDHLKFSKEYPTDTFAWWTSPVFYLDHTKGTPFGDGWACGAAEERERCSRLALAEQVSGETDTPEDLAYNQACKDIAEAIQRIQ